MKTIFNWFTGFCLTLGFLLGYMFKDNHTKPDEVTNIENNTKIKKNLAAVETNAEISTEKPTEQKPKRRFGIFKRKNKK